MKFQRVEKAELEGTCHVGEMHVPPAALVATFGEPSERLNSRECIGEYYFESADGDYYSLYSLDADVTPENAEEKERQFWVESEPVPFSIAAQHDRDVHDFKFWVREQTNEHT